MRPPIRLLNYSYQTVHFVFFYTYANEAGARTDRSYSPTKMLNTRHGVRNFSFVENFSVYFEYVWTFFLDGSVRFKRPPSVSKTLGAKRRGKAAFQKYRVYIYDCGNSLGATFPDKIDLTTNIASSFIGVRNSYDGLRANDDPNPEQGLMKVTAAHEFFHAIQLGYRLGGPDWSWWLEASATFMEDEAFDAVNDYRNYLAAWANAPHLPLDTFNGTHEYGTVLFCKYLSECFEPEIIQRICKRKQNETALGAIDGALRNRKNRLARLNGKDVFSSGFVVSNLVPQDSELGYSEGQKYPTVRISQVYSVYPVQKTTVLIDHLAASYILFRPDSENPRTLKLTLISRGDNKPPIRAAALIKEQENKQVELLRWHLDRKANRYTSQLEVDQFARSGGKSELVLILANVSYGREKVNNVPVIFSADLI